MFSKKITNDDNEISPKIKTRKIKEDKTGEIKNEGFWASRKVSYDEVNKRSKAWIADNKSLYKKYKIITSVIVFSGIGGFLGMYVTGEVQKDMYRVNYDQNVQLVYLNSYSKSAIPLFQRYTSVTPPNPIASETVAAINETVKYLVLFQYITSLDDNNFTFINFNVWVQKYQQWPQSNSSDNPLQVLETKDNYVNTINKLVSQITTRINPDIPLAEINSMSGFARILNSIDMNVYATITWYQNAGDLAVYAFIPLLVSVISVSGISIWINSKQKKWFREHASELQTPEEMPTKQ